MTVRSTILAWLLPLTLGSCCFDSSISCADIDPDKPQTVLVRLDADWSEFGNEPTGMTVALYPDSGARVEEASNDVRSMYLNIEPQRYRLLLYNLTPGEFSSMTFSDMSSYDSARVALARLRRTNRNWDAGAVYFQEPEALGTATDTLTATDGLFDNASERLIRGDSIIYVYPETVHPATTKLTVLIYVKGLTNARGIEGSVSGMARSYLLTQGHAETDTARMLLGEWNAALDTTDKDGWIEAEIQTLSLPYEKDVTLADRDSTANELILYFQLQDGKTTVTYRRPVGHKFQYTEEDDSHTIVQHVTHSMILEIGKDDSPPDLPDVKGDNNNSSGFDADVDKWDDGGTKDVTF